VLRADETGEVRFQVLAVASMKITVFRDAALFSLAEIHRSFGGAYCLMMEAASPLKRRSISTILYSSTSQNTIILKTGEHRDKFQNILFSQMALTGTEQGPTL
jgi:hypothetical protein